MSISNSGPLRVPGSFPVSVTPRAASASASAASAAADNLALSGASGPAVAPAASTEDVTLPDTSTPWMVAVDLTANIAAADARTNQPGSIGFQRQQILRLAAQTRNTNKSFLVQSLDPASQTIQRELIRNGQVTALGAPQPSKGFGADLKDLVSLASSNQYLAEGVDPQQLRLGLIIQSHGYGVDGLTGEFAQKKGQSLSAGALGSAIRAGLRAGRGGHDKLDLLDLDACLMGQREVLDQFAGTTHQMVASADEENSDLKTIETLNAARAGIMKGNLDTQDIAGDLGRLLTAKPKDGQAFGAQIVAQAQSDAQLAAQNEQLLKLAKKADGTTLADAFGMQATNTTLGSFNLDRLGSLQQPLDTLGQQLNQALDAGWGPLVDTAIKATTAYGAQADSAHATLQYRDLNAFAQQLISGIDALPAADQSQLTGLRQSAQALQSSLEASPDGFVSARLNQGQTAQGDLGAFLPDATYLSNNAALRAQNLAKATDRLRQAVTALSQSQSDPDQSPAKLMQLTLQSFNAFYGQLEPVELKQLPVKQAPNVQAFQTQLAALMTPNPQSTDADRFMHGLLVMRYIKANEAYLRTLATEQPDFVRQLAQLGSERMQHMTATAQAVVPQLSNDREWLAEKNRGGWNRFVQRLASEHPRQAG